MTSSASSGESALPAPKAPLPADGLTLICGPSGGGKSRWAEHLASLSGQSVTYLATGPLLPDDLDWQQRLQRHRRRRPVSWECREVQGELAAALFSLERGQLALIDSLGTWVAAWLPAAADDWSPLCDQLVDAIQRCPASLLLVCEEVGWGVVPSSAQGCLFRQRQADLVQRLMPLAAQAWLVFAGRALDLQRLAVPVPAEP
jgi:adenosylcobinamide kinase/adenosylcobinamide-phosphate guanylyltransferase